MFRKLCCLSLIALLPLTMATLPTRAAVTTSGSVNADPPAVGGSFPSTEVVVGDANDNVNSILGTMRIDNGTDLLLDRLIVGDEAAYIGDVVVTGAGTTLTTDSSFQSNPALQIGKAGTGYLTVAQQAAVHVSNSNGNLVIGRDATSAGLVTIDGLLTQLSFGEDLIVGSAGYGELKLTDGAMVYPTDPAGSTATIGAVAGGVGYVEVDGAHTLWRLPETVAIGVTGAGTLRISREAVVHGNDGVSGGITVGTTGAIDLDNGRLFADSLTINGRLSGDGLVTGPVLVGVAGEVGASAGEKLRFTGAVTNEGVVNVSGDRTTLAEVEFGGSLINSNGTPVPGRIAVADGVVRFLQPLTNKGTLAATSGIADFHGDIINSATGLIAIGGGSNATFYDDVDVTAGVLNITAGSTALFLGDISISASANLAIELNPASLEEGFSTPLQGVGGATLDTLIQLTLTEGFVPTLGDEFELISAAAGLAIGVVNPDKFAALPAGLQWDVLLTNETVTAIVIASGIPGDFNHDNSVTAADFLIWQRDPSVGDLSDWQANYGTFASLAANATTIPEPSLFLLGTWACILGSSYKRRRRGVFRI